MSWPPLNWSNWQGRQNVRNHLSYSYNNPYEDDDYHRYQFRELRYWGGMSAEYAVAADINPGTADSNQNVLVITTTSSNSVMKEANSRNHQRNGQNVLYGDGHVEWQTNPFCGVQRDNIYARRAGSRGWASSAVRDSPYDMNDNVLLPTDE